MCNKYKNNRKVQGEPQSQTAANPRHQEEEKNDKKKKKKKKLTRTKQTNKCTRSPQTRRPSPSEVIAMLEK